MENLFTDSNIIIMLFALLSLVAILLIIIALRLKDERQEIPAELQGLLGIRGRVEKIEQALNEIKTESIRTIEINSTRLESLQHKIKFLEDHLELDLSNLIEEAQRLEKSVSKIIEEDITKVEEAVSETTKLLAADKLAEDVSDQEIKENLDIKAVAETAVKQNQEEEDSEKKKS